MVSFNDFKRIDLRVARVESVEPHPQADKLMVLKIDVGLEKKQIVAGLVGHYKPEELVGKNVVVVNNLQPVVLRGVESQGMLLAAQDGDQVVLVTPERHIAAGSQVS